MTVFYMTIRTSEQLALHGQTVDNQNIDSIELIKKSESYKPAKLAAKGKLIDAVMAAQTLVEEKPHEAAAYLCAGNIMMKANLKEDGLKHLKTATAMAPRNRFVRLAYARALATTGHTGDAIIQYKQLSARAPNFFEVRMELAQLLMLHNEPGEAVTELKELIKLFPEKSVLHKMCGVALAKSGKAEAGLDEYMAGVEAEGRTGRPEALGSILSGFASMDKAKYYLQQRVAEKPDDPLLKLRLAQVYMYLDKYPEAKNALVQAKEKDPSNPEIHRSLAVLYQKTNERKSAVTEFMQSVSMEKDANKNKQAAHN